jgi:NitT/TauT family transport system substrate-binding protein
VPTRPRRGLAAVAAVIALTAAACGSSSPGASRPTAAGAPPLVGTVTTAGISPDRCAANRAAGRITYLSGFDFAASASIVDVVMAKAKGYFAQMCLDVSLKPSFSTSTYPLVAAGQAQFASAGSYSEVVSYSKNGAHFTALAVEGKTAINTLLVKTDAGVKTLADLKGKTIGVLGVMPPAVTAMLAKAGLKDGQYKTVQLDGFDPIAHFQLAIAGRPGFQSNEPGILQRAGVPFLQFNPSDQGIPGSFGVLYSSPQFVADHPTAAQDFLRATMKGLADAVADPDAAVEACLQLIETAGNQNHLTADGERFRWRTESKLVTSSTPAGQPLGLVDPPALEREVAAYAAVGAMTAPPTLTGTYDAQLVKGVYDAAGTVIWPAATSTTG